MFSLLAKLQFSDFSNDDQDRKKIMKLLNCSILSALTLPEGLVECIAVFIPSVDDDIVNKFTLMMIFFMFGFFEEYR